MLCLYLRFVEGKEKKMGKTRKDSEVTFFAFDWDIYTYPVHMIWLAISFHFTLIFLFLEKSRSRHSINVSQFHGTRKNATLFDRLLVYREVIVHNSHETQDQLICLAIKIVHRNHRLVLFLLTVRSLKVVARMLCPCSLLFILALWFGILDHWLMVVTNYSSPLHRPPSFF